MKIRSLSHATYQHQYHIIWGTKYRRKFLQPYVSPKLKESIYKTLEKDPALIIEIVNVDIDHVHIQLEIPPSIAVCKAIQEMKKQSSKDLKKHFKFIKNMYIDGSIWSVGYFSSTIGLNEEQIKKYIENQGKEDLPREVGFKFS